MGMFHLLREHCLFVGELPSLEPHAPHAVTLCVATESELRIRFSPQGGWTTFVAGIIAPDIPYELDGRGAQICILRVGPETAAGRRLSLKTSLTPPAALGRLPLHDPMGIRDVLLKAFSTSIVRHVDPRVLSVLRHMRSSSGRVPSTEFAAAVALSPSRLAHLFRAQTNISVKRYSLWLRILAAFRTVPSNDSFSGIAYRAGFADGAHFSRAFRRMLGAAPSVLRRYSFCDSHSISVQEHSRFVQWPQRSAHVECSLTRS